MSDFYIRLIPRDPDLVVDQVALDAALASFEHLVPDADEVKAEQTLTVNFVDPGENLDHVSCPECRAELDFDWWQEAMGCASESEFNDLAVVVPCCGASTSLNDLAYDFPAGFARSVLEALNPNIASLSDEDLETIAVPLGTPLRQILAHY